MGARRPTVAQARIAGRRSASIPYAHLRASPGRSENPGVGGSIPSLPTIPFPDDRPRSTFSCPWNGSRAASSRDVLREQLVDERLVAEPPLLGLASDRLEDTRVDTDSDQAPGFGAERRSADPPHGGELRG